MKLNFAAFALLVCGALCCGESYGNDLLGRMMGRGCGADAVPTCCDTPAMACGGHSFGSGLGIRRGFLGGRCGRGIGCGSYANVGCGCDNVLQSTGCCDPCQRGLFNGRLRGRMSGMFNRGCGGFGGCDMGCDSGCAGAPLAAGCGCDAGFDPCCDPCASRGLLSGMGGRLRGRLGGIGCGSCCDMGCDMGCAAPIAAGCGCNDGAFAGGMGCGCGLGLGGRLRGRFADCGCGGAPLAAGCGCNDGAFAGDCGCGFGGRRVGLLDRLRSRGNACCFDSGCGMAIAGANCGCNGGYHDHGHQHNGDAGAMEGNGNSEGIVAPPTGENGAVRTPRIDPNAFIIRNAGHRN